jgi:hypothetical protein
MNRVVVVAGLLLLALGLLWPWLSKLPFGRLPGDIAIERNGFSFYFPLLTCLILSVVASCYGGCCGGDGAPA